MHRGKIELDIEGMEHDDIQRVYEILEALLRSGGLFGVRGGKTILHFDQDGVFQGVELDYWPWRRRKG